MQTFKHPRTILVGEDEPEVAGYFEMALKCLGYSIELAQHGDEVLSCFQSGRSEIAAVLLDIMIPNRDGLDTLRALRDIDPHLPVIMVSGSSSPLNIVNAMKCGATDFLCKPVAHEDLRKAVSRALEMKEVVFAFPSRKTAPLTNSYWGTNPRMKEIQALVGEIAWSEVPVIQGETGSGKEVVARELHALEMDLWLTGIRAVRSREDGKLYLLDPKREDQVIRPCNGDYVLDYEFLLRPQLAV